MPAQFPEALEVHIDELVLHGFAPGDRFRISDAVERELAYLLQERGIPRGLREPFSVTSLDGGSFKLSPGTRSKTVGAAVAGKLYESFPQEVGAIARRTRTSKKGIGENGSRRTIRS